MEKVVARIKSIMENEGYSAAEFADTLGIGRPLLSHVLSGRNNPSLQLVMKILEHFPSYSADWLIHGGAQEQAAPAHDKPQAQLSFLDEAEETTPLPPTQVPAAPKRIDMENRVSKSEPTRVVFFFGDGTFETYISRK